MYSILQFMTIEVGGQSHVEYSLILAIFVLVCIAGLKVLSESTSNLYNETETKLP